MATWPASLPLPSVRTEGTISPSVIRTEMESGSIRQRKRFSQQLQSYQVSITLLESQVPTFLNFHKTTLNYGNDWFSIDLTIDGDVETKTVRFIGAGYSISRSDNQAIIKTVWEVQE